MTVVRSLDMWRCAIVKKCDASISQGDLTADNLQWLPHPGRFAFRADPFGLWDAGKLHVFVEHFDYRSPKGAIESLVFDDRFGLLESRTVLSRPWHLSYPFTFRAEGEIWMLPEARQSGQLTLYRARDFPGEWEPAAIVDIDPAAVDATPLFHEGRWWLFYARGRRKAPETMELNLAFSARLTGPWRPHPLNPVRRGLRTRPGGTPTVRENGHIDLPIQDSVATYGASVRRLGIRRLDPEHFEAEDFAWLDPPPQLAPYIDGLHTLAAAGDVHLVDFKRIDRSLMGTLAWRLGRLGRSRAPSLPKRQ